VSAAAESHATPTLAAIAREIGRLGLLGFGGIGPQAYHVFVTRTQWLSPEEFAELSGVGQALPGPNIVNLVAICGDRWHGPSGTLVALAALIVPPAVVALVLAALIEPFAGAARVVAVESAIVAACAGLTLATTLRVLGTIAQRRTFAFALCGALAAFVLWRSTQMPYATIAAVGVGFAVELLALRRAR